MPLADARDLWNATLSTLQMEVTRPTYETWLRGTWGAWDEEGTLVVGTPNPFVASWLEKRMYSLIKRTVEEVAKGPVEVRFQVVSASGPRRPPVEAEEAAPHASARAPGVSPNGGSPLSARYTFGSFVVGKSNQLAHAAAQAVADSPGRRYNPLFVYSGVGLGKTHLLHAIGHRLSERDLSTLYVSAEQFTNEFIKAIREGTTEAFRTKYRSVDVLLIDDIQFISEKEQTQEGFFHTFNELHNANRQIVLTSDRPPRSMALLEDRLRSRFEWGLIADIQPPELETRISILQQRAAAQQMAVPYEVIDFLARKVMRNIRELEGSLNRVVASASLTNQAITLELASQTLGDLQYGPTPPTMEPSAILNTVATYFGLDPSALTGTRRLKRIALARHVAMYLLREDAMLPVTRIGRLMGGRDHSTVISACSKVSYAINVDPELRRSVIAIRNALREAHHRASQVNGVLARAG